MPQKTEAAGRYSLCDNGLSVKDIGFVLALARHGLRPFLPMRDEPGCDVPIKVALAVATLRFRKVCAFVTISSNRPCLSSSTRAAAAALRNALRIRGSGARPEVSQRIVKDRPPCPYIMILRQDRPTLSPKETKSRLSPLLMTW